jgi:hypothetical protein
MLIPLCTLYVLLTRPSTDHFDPAKIKSKKNKNEQSQYGRIPIPSMLPFLLRKSRPSEALLLSSRIPIQRFGNTVHPVFAAPILGQHTGEWVSRCGYGHVVTGM